MLCCPIPAEGRMYGPKLVCPCVYEAVGQAVVRPESSFYPDRGVVGPLHCPDLVVVVPPYARDLVPPRRTEVAVCAVGNSWLGA